jgi:hypothetical protein
MIHGFLSIAIAGAVAGVVDMDGAGEARGGEQARGLEIDWKQGAPPAMGSQPAEVGARSAWVEILHEADSLGCAVTFTSLDRPGDEPIRLCMAVKRSAWIVLDPGEWRIEMRVGRPNGDAVDLPARRERIRRGEAHRLTFGETHENEARRHFEDAARQRREATATPPPEGAP